MKKKLNEVEPILLDAVEGRIQKLKLQHPYTKEYVDTVIELYEARNKPDQAAQLRAKL